MNDINSIGFALDPTNVPSFLLDWEVTKVCNLDCSYCPTEGEWANHDNSTNHPTVEECVKSIDLMYEYVDLYMKHKKSTQRKVILNLLGGEVLFHPDIVKILSIIREKYEPYKSKWFLTVTCTTNAVIGKNLWSKIVPLIDEFQLSYHTENLSKQKKQYLNNALYLKQQNKRFKCIIMMHTNPELFKDAESVIEFCKQNELRYLAKPLDVPESVIDFYSQNQFDKLKTIWISQVPIKQQSNYAEKINKIGNSDTVTSINEGRACCGGRPLSLNGDLKSNISFVPRQGFEGWSCSVNWFFLFVQQLSGNVYTNRDCRMSTTGQVEPLGNINNTDHILSTLRAQFETNTMPVINCKKKICYCGICAPKAESKTDFMDLIKRHVPVDVFQKEC